MIIAPDYVFLIPWAVIHSKAKEAQSFSHLLPKATLQHRIRPINSFYNSSPKCPSSAVKFVGVQSSGSRFPSCAAALFLTNCSGTFPALHEFSERIVKCSSVSLLDAFSLGRAVLTKSKSPQIVIPHPLLQIETALRSIINNQDCIEHPVTPFPSSDSWSCNSWQCSLLLSLAMIHSWLSLPCTEVT